MGNRCPGERFKRHLRVKLDNGLIGQYQDYRGETKNKCGRKDKIFTLSEIRPIDVDCMACLKKLPEDQKPDWRK
jgi:hypothetical protein